MSAVPRRRWGTGSLYQRKSDGRWIGRARGRYVTGTNRDEVKARLAVLKSSPSPRTTDTVAEFLERWLAVTQRRLRSRTVDGYRDIVDRHIVPGLGGIRLAELNGLDVQAWVDGQHGAPRSVAHRLACLRTALTHAQRNGLVDRNATVGVELPRIPRTAVTPLTVAQARAFLDATTDDRLSALYVLALTTGMRQGELLGLRWKDVAEDSLTIRKTLRFRQGKALLEEPKTERSLRTLPLSSMAVAALRRHKARQNVERLATDWTDAGLVFTTEHGSPLEAWRVTRNFQQRLADAGLPKVRFHDLRHTAASLMLERSGGNLRLVMEMLGHSTITTTADIYAHLAAEAKRRAADDMDALLG
jgi:integrase